MQAERGVFMDRLTNSDYRKWFQPALIVAVLQKLVWAFVIGAAIGGCKPAATQVAAGMRFEPHPEPEPGIVHKDLPLLIDHTAITEPELHHFYTARNFTGAWLTQHRVLPVADSMLWIISNARLYGLDPEEYNFSEISKLLVDVRTEGAGKEKVDVLLTDALLTMARHLKNGRLIPNTNRLALQPAAADSAVVALLSDAVERNNVRKTLESLEPAHLQYVALKAELAKNYARLGQEDGPDQAGLDIIESRLRTLQVNMERWRWEASELPQRYILINIPAYTLKVYEGTDVVFASRVIVGARETPTPVLQSTIWRITIYPYWNVPQSIAVKEILPKQQKDTTYLRRNFYDVLDARGNVLDSRNVDWAAYSEKNFPYYIRQREGEENALGIIKFTFDNPYSVYLHDTNAKALFKREKRALSHGCIRLEKARELAYYLVKDDKVYSNPQTLEEYFNKRRRSEISLLYPMPIYVRYFTAEAADGEGLYFPDIYKKDKAQLGPGML